MPTHEPLKFRTLFEIPPLYRSAAFRDVPRGSGRRFAGVAINAQHPTLKCEIDENTVDGDAGKTKGRAANP